MKSPQRRSNSPLPVDRLRAELERLLGALGELAAARGQHLQPALVPIPVGTGPRLPRELPPAGQSLHLAFGRRKDGKSGDEPAGDNTEAADDSGDLTDDADPALDQLPPIPSALGAADLKADPEEEVAADDTVSSWRPLESTGDSPAPEATDAGAAGESSPEPDLPSWSSNPSPFEVPAAASTGGSGPESGEPTPWGSAGPDDEPATFTPAVVDSTELHPDNLSWLQSGPTGETAPWAVHDDQAPAADLPAAVESFTDPVVDLGEVEEIEPETPQDEELGGGPEGLDSFSEVLTISDEPWSSPALVMEEAVTFQPAPPISIEPTPAEVAALQTRSFPLPEGEVVFRNLRAGFTDPARLLRHLAGEGHTGVLHVQGVDGSNSYVVLVDGYVVAVANDRQGNITTSSRISFPNFPNSQDTINVISYGRQIARGLGLLLHAPVRFAGLGAMFVNLEGLRSYLSKYSSSGGLIVHAQDGIGVALFEDGKLVGAYANGNSPTTDLGQLRDLVKDLEAEIDVRFGGPQELEPTPLDTLLSGYPL
ncbi:MAG TPA: hypothetical protein VNH38_00585 [Candidatus Dormibacteraeota bacterium]|nr:hypothetical protein [Candidatus Dormibacteraeota bacterium]